MVRVGTPSAVARPDWYDRNPVTRFRAWNAVNLAPHTSTQRWTYTVPAGKKAQLELVQVKVMRATAPTTPGYAYANIRFTPSGGSVDTLIQATIRTGTVGDTDQTVLGVCGVLQAGDTIEANSADGSTGGTIDYFATLKITEFDA